ncbi:MAG: hypothetical protein PHE25_04565 [Candidatus Gracilibacteria bacterium]|nr:hypothetical protein [Candidatus Gracilibacteria bacterium]
MAGPGEAPKDGGAVIPQKADKGGTTSDKLDQAIQAKLTNDGVIDLNELHDLQASFKDDRDELTQKLKGLGEKVKDDARVALNVMIQECETNKKLTQTLVTLLDKKGYFSSGLGTENPTYNLGQGVYIQWNSGSKSWQVTKGEGIKTGFEPLTSANLSRFDLKQNWFNGYTVRAAAEIKAAMQPIIDGNVKINPLNIPGASRSALDNFDKFTGGISQKIADGVNSGVKDIGSKVGL